MELHLLAPNSLLAVNGFCVIFKAKCRIKGEIWFLRNAGKIAHRDMAEKPTVSLSLSSSVFHALSFHLFLDSFFPILFHLPFAWPLVCLFLPFAPALPLFLVSSWTFCLGFSLPFHPFDSFGLLVQSQWLAVGWHFQLYHRWPHGLMQKRRAYLVGCAVKHRRFGASCLDCLPCFAKSEILLQIWCNLFVTQVWMAGAPRR